MSDAHPASDLGKQSARLVAQGRAAAARSHELVDKSRGLIARSLDRAYDHDVTLIRSPVRRSAGLSVPTAVALSGLSLAELWLAYVGIGGDHSAAQFQSFLRGELTLSRNQFQILAHAVNEHFWQQGVSGVLDEE